MIKNFKPSLSVSPLIRFDLTHYGQCNNAIHTVHSLALLAPSALLVPVPRRVHYSTEADDTANNGTGLGEEVQEGRAGLLDFDQEG